MADFPTLSVAPTTLEETIEDATIRSEFEGGFELTRNKFTRDRSTFLVTYTTLTKVDKDLVIDFVKQVRGAQEFTWVNHDQPIDGSNPVTYTPYTVRFSEFPKIPAVGGRWQLYDISFTVREV